MNEFPSFEGMLSRLVEEAVRRALPAREGAVLEKRLLKVKDVAEIIGLSPRSVRELVARGDIPTRDVEPYNCILIERSDLDRWIEGLPRRRVGSEQEAAQTGER